MRRVLLVLVATLALTGCAAQAARDPSPPPASVAPSRQPASGNLRGTDWRFVKVADTPVPAGVTATLRLQDGRASGKAGCNAYGASWETSADGRTKFGAVMSTKMACISPAGAMQVEHGVLDALQHAARLQRDGESLVLLDASGRPLAELVPNGAR